MGARTYSPDRHLNAFGEWMVANGGFIHESLTFTAPDSEFGSQVRTASEIPPNSRLLTCPHTLAIDYTKARAHYSSSFIDATTPHAALCMFLAYQWLEGEKSFWWPYLRILPREFGTPLYFDDDDLMWLQGCNLDAKEVEARKGVWKDELETAVAALKKDGVDTRGYTWELFLWAATVFSSRSFSGKLMAWTDDLSMASMGEPDSLPALFPLIDSVNHQPLTKITWQPGTHALSAVSGDTIPPGGEVCNNYGPKSNEELLMGYGFTLPSNPFDTVVLRINPPLTPDQKAVHALHTTPSPDGIYHLSPRVNGASAYPRDLISLFQILTATPSELPLLATPHAAPTLRNTLATHNQLLVALRQKLANFPREPSLPPCNTPKRSSAKIYRDAQIHLLLAAITESESLVAASLRDDPRAVTLASILAPLPPTTTTTTTTTTPAPFRTAVEKCFGTADETELEQAEQADIVFTLYICWRYILYLRHPPPQPPHHPPNSPATTTATDDQPPWNKWIHALVSTAKHGTTHEKEHVPEAGEFVRELYDGIFPAAAEIAPGVFGGAEWTPEALSWGMRVFGGEGVAVWSREDEEAFVVCVE